MYGQRGISSSGSSAAPSYLEPKPSRPQRATGSPHSTRSHKSKWSESKAHSTSNQRLFPIYCDKSVAPSEGGEYYEQIASSIPSSAPRPLPTKTPRSPTQTTKTPKPTTKTRTIDIKDCCIKMNLKSKLSRPPWWGIAIIGIGVAILLAVVIGIVVLGVVGPFGERKLDDDLVHGEYTTCKDAKVSGIYLVKILDLQFRVYCYVDTESKWTVIQRRYDGSEDFYRYWSDYKTGFGELSKEFWLGNEKLHLLTTLGLRQLRVDLEDWDGNKNTIYYQDILIGVETDGYPITVGAYIGGTPPGDSLKSASGAKFQTQELTAGTSGNLARKHGGGWWYKSINQANPNGIYNGTADGKGIYWKSWNVRKGTLKSISLMIK